MSHLFDTIEIPMRRKILSPLFFCHSRLFFLLLSGLWSIAQFFEQQNKLIVHFKNAVARIRETSHDSPTARSIHSGSFLPNNSSHIVHTERFTKTDYLCSDRNDFVSAIIYRTSELISDIDAQSTTVRKNTITLFPHQIQIVNVFFIAIVKANLIFCTIIF